MVHGPAPGLLRWVFTTNHKDIGTLYLLFALLMFFVGGAALLLRWLDTRRQASLLGEPVLARLPHHPRTADAVDVVLAHLKTLSPRQQAVIHELGLPGLHFAKEPHRVYPAGAEASHVLGQVDIDNKGLAGIEVFNTTCRCAGRGESSIHWDDWMALENRLYPAMANE